jgi:hypothetical protein
MNSSQRCKRDQQFRPLRVDKGWVWPVRCKRPFQWQWHEWRDMPRENRIERAMVFQWQKRIGQ